MQLYGTIILDDFASAHPDCRGCVAAWRMEVETVTWTTPQHMQERHLTAQSSHGGRVVFRLLKGLYMLDTKVMFDRGIVLIENVRFDGQPAVAATRTSKK